MCRRSVRILHALDWFDRLAFADAADDAARSRVAPGLDRDRALAEMHVISGAGLVAGYDAYLRLATALPLLWLPGAFGRLPLVARLGRGWYRRIAARRTRDGRCTDEVCAPGPGGMPPARHERPRALTPVAVAVTGLFLVQQIVVSALRLESEPFVSNFPMYSSTWPSPEAFDAHYRKATRRYELSTDTLRPAELARRLQAIPDGEAVVRQAVEDAADGKAADDALRARVTAVLRAYAGKYGEEVGPVRAVRHETVFDWRHGAFADREAGTVGPVVLSLPADQGKQAQY